MTTGGGSVGWKGAGLGSTEQDTGDMKRGTPTGEEGGQYRRRRNEGQRTPRSLDKLQ